MSDHDPVPPATEAPTDDQPVNPDEQAAEPTAPAQPEPAPSKPARRRRSASRAAGAPSSTTEAAVVVTSPAAEPPPTPEPTATQASAEPGTPAGSAPAESAPAESAPAGSASVDSAPAPEEKPAPRRRRRAATRPAGTPAPVQPTAAPESASRTDEQSATEAPVPPETGPAAGDDEPAAEPEQEKPRRSHGGRSRRRAGDADDTPAAAAGDEPAGDETAATEPAAEQETRRSRGGRSRRRSAGADEAAAAETQGEPAGPTEEPEQAPTRSRGRRTRPTAALANPFATPADDAAADEATPGAETAEDEEPTGDPLSAAVRAVFDQADRETGDDREEEQTAEPTSEDEDEDEDEDAGSDVAEDDEGEEQPRRRRRRRGGRRRRRGSGADADEDDPDSGEDAGSDDETEDSAQGPAGQDAADDGEGEEDAGEQSSGRRRRRRRRRRGEDASASDDDPSDTVVRVREPRRSAREKASDQITGIDGSTRLEAKRQRRREGRQSSRRRTPILSEAEFLARREAVERTMVIRQRDDLSQLAVLEDGVLVEHYVDRESATSLIGNVYLGRVQNVLPSMEAAFVDIGRGRNAVLYAGEVDWDAHGAAKSERQIEKVLKSGQTVLVQVTKDPVGAKGARLTNHVSFPGRYVVYSPGGHLSGISRKLPDNERKRLKNILSDLVPDEASVIVRTAAEGASEDELVRDVNRLKAQWETIEKKIRSGSAPQLLYAEPDLTLRIVRDLFTEDFATLVVDGNAGQDDAFETVESYVAHVAPHLAERLQRWDAEEKGDVFAAHRLDEQIAKALDRKVFLPSGGSLIIDRTEAMTVVDVNTGKFTGSGGNLETTVTSNNLEAAEEIVRQLRLRDIGGIIVIDFIDMVLPSNRELLLRRLVECLGRDRTRHQVAEVTSLGLVQMTRKKIGTGLAEAFTEPCEHCDGLGYHTHEVPVHSQHAADGGERSSRKGRSGRNKGGKGRGKKGEGQTEEPVRRNGGPQDVYAAMHKDDTKDDDGGAAVPTEATSGPEDVATADLTPVEQSGVEQQPGPETASNEPELETGSEQAAASSPEVEADPVETATEEATATDEAERAEEQEPTAG